MSNKKVSIPTSETPKCDSPVIYKDEYICIVQPDNPKGVEVLHAVGYMDPIGTNANEERHLLKVIERTGLKSSAAILKEKKGVTAPIKTDNEDIEYTDNNVSARKAFLRYDPLQLYRIFLRPPSTAPPNWRAHVGTPREHRLFFGGESYSTSGQASANAAPGRRPIGVVTLRVDPDETYVFLESMKGVENRNRETGMRVPVEWRQYPKASERYLASKMLLSDYLDALSKGSDTIRGDYEIIATLPTIPPCAFAKVIPHGKLVPGEEELPENLELQEKTQKIYSNWVKRGNALEKEVSQIIFSIRPLQMEYFRKEAKLTKESASEISEKIIKLMNYKKLNAKQLEELIKYTTMLKERSNEIITTLKEAEEKAKAFLPIQKIQFQKFVKEISGKLKDWHSVYMSAVAHIKEVKPTVAPSAPAAPTPSSNRPRRAAATKPKEGGRRSTRKMYQQSRKQKMRRGKTQKDYRLEY
jgi:hypothetical protein